MGYIENMKSWFESEAVEKSVKEEIESLIESGKDDELKDRFESMMEFGTAGLRGLMRAGLNGMNIYTVRYATQGFADVIKAAVEAGEEIGGGVSIAHDCRLNSRLFAEEAASVLAGNGIHVFLFDDLRPTPELSFTVRETSSIAGINITASHNPKEYNGYKAYWSDGAQIGEEHANAISSAMAAIDMFEDIKRMHFDQAVEAGLITIIGEDMDEKYLAKVIEQSIGREYVEEVADDFEIVYTPFHGCGYKLVPEVLRRIGLKKINFVDEQMVIDGNFPTVKSPNPENVEGFALAIEYAKRGGNDLIIGTDPDSDRCGIVVRDGDDYLALTGNQIGVLLLDYIINVRKSRGMLPENAGAIKSIVTTKMADKVCSDNGVHISETFTGFKNIGARMKEYEETGEHTFIFGFEESIGFLVGTYARDKDAVVAAMLIAEMGCWYKSRGMNLAQGLKACYEKYGYYKEKTVSHVFEGFGAQEKMAAKMDEIRAGLPDDLGFKVKRIRDYQKDEIINLETGDITRTGQDGTSDVLIFDLEDDCLSAIRPSGTEPKIKLYLMARGESEQDADQKLKKVTEASLALLK